MEFDNIDSSNIRNIGILGHSGSGKSNMVEGLEFTAGLTNRIVGNEMILKLGKFEDVRKKSER